MSYHGGLGRSSSLALPWLWLRARLCGCEPGQCPEPPPAATSGLGAVYTIGTNVPLLGNVEADIPVDQMTRDAISAAAPTGIAALVFCGVLGGVAGGFIAGRYFR